MLCRCNRISSGGEPAQIGMSLRQQDAELPAWLGRHRADLRPIRARLLCQRHRRAQLSYVRPTLVTPDT